MGWLLTPGDNVRGVIKQINQKISSINAKSTREQMSEALSAIESAFDWRLDERDLYREVSGCDRSRFQSFMDKHHRVGFDTIYTPDYEGFKSCLGRIVSSLESEL